MKILRFFIFLRVESPRRFRLLLLFFAFSPIIGEI